MPELRNLRPSYGAAIEGNGLLIRINCPKFNGLEVLDWHSSVLLPSAHADPDQALADFLNDIKPESLKSFTKLRHHRLGFQTFHALSCHADTLTELVLRWLPSRTLTRVSQLKRCTNLVSFSLGGDGMVSDAFDEVNRDGFLETVAWLKECKKLRCLALTRFYSASTLMTPILLDDSINLTFLEYQGQGSPDTGTFHQALANKTSLKTLWLKQEKDSDEYYPMDMERADALMECLSRLVNLTSLRLRRLSDYFTDLHVVRLAGSLLKLETLSIIGCMLSDDIWDAVACLRSLQTLIFGATTKFTSEGILGFIEKLGPGNEGMVLSVMLWDPESDALGESYELIKGAIAEKVRGKFILETGGEYWHGWYEILGNANFI